MDLEQRTRSIVAEPLYTAMGSIAGIRTVIYVAEAGVHLLTHAPDLNSLLGQIGVVLFEGPEEKVVEDAKYVASVATLEKERNYRVPHSLSAIGIWGVLEAGIDDFMVEYLLYSDSGRWKPEVGQVKIPLAEYEGLAPRNRMQFLVARLKETSKAKWAPGAGRFENLLTLVDLGGPVEDEVARTLVELSAVRNVLAHRAGVIDEEFVKRCPWFNKEIGEHVSVGSSDVQRYVTRAFHT